VRVLIVEHDPLSTPERVGAHLEKRGGILEHFVVVEDVADPEVTVEFPEDRYDLVVAMGAPWSVYDPRLRGWVGPELEMIRDRTNAGAPVLGICFGAQAMSSALGGTVAMSSRPEYGWGSIEPLIDEIATGPWFQFHHDEFTLPSGAIELARNQSGLQAFTISRNLAVQFHPEMDGDLIESWCRAGGDEELEAAGVDPVALVEESHRLAVETQPALERMLDWYLDEIVGSAG
jgi:GMP synthase-like glutamine amidotransferase